jgi:hypothetical protein
MLYELIVVFVRITLVSTGDTGSVLSYAVVYDARLSCTPFQRDAISWKMSCDSFPSPKMAELPIPFSSPKVLIHNLKALSAAIVFSTIAEYQTFQSGAGTCRYRIFYVFQSLKQGLYDNIYNALVPILTYRLSTAIPPSHTNTLNHSYPPFQPTIPSHHSTIQSHPTPSEARQNAIHPTPQRRHRNHTNERPHLGT